MEVRFKQGTKFDQGYFQELLEEVREIRASERMMYQKITDIYATAADYSPQTAAAERIFASVQTKLHFAITGHTAAEIIAERVDPQHPSMGLTTWKKGPGGKILKTDIGTAKNCNYSGCHIHTLSFFLSSLFLSALRNRSTDMPIVSQPALPTLTPER